MIRALDWVVLIMMLLSTAACAGIPDVSAYDDPKSGTAVAEDLSSPSVTIPANNEIDEAGWTVVMILSSHEFERIGDVDSASALRSFPTVSKEYYRLSQRSDKVETLDWNNQVCSFDDGFLCINGEAEKIVFRKTIELCSDSDVMRMTLESLGVNDELKEVVAVTAFGYPLVLFVECESSVVIVTIDDEQDYILRDMEHFDDYVLRVYSPDEFKDKFGPQNCLVYINGVLSANCRALKYGSGEEIYLMSVLRCFDPSAEIIVNERSGDLRFLGSDYIVDLTECSISAIDGGPKETGIPPGSSTQAFVQDGDIVLNLFAFRRMLQGLNINVEMSYENGSYRIDVNSDY